MDITAMKSFKNRNSRLQVGTLYIQELNFLYFLNFQHLYFSVCTFSIAHQYPTQTEQYVTRGKAKVKKV